jgi:hypothetical protein
MYPHFTSNHPPYIFSGILHTESTRYNHLCSTKDEYDFLINLFTIRLIALDYPMHIIKPNITPWHP